MPFVSFPSFPLTHLLSFFTLVSPTSLVSFKFLAFFAPILDDEDSGDEGGQLSSHGAQAAAAECLLLLASQYPKVPSAARARLLPLLPRTLHF